MREAVGAVLRHGFEAVGLHRVKAFVAVANERSAHLLRRLGFAHEGLLHECSFSGGRFHDHELYALLRQANNAGAGSSPAASPTRTKDRPGYTN